MKLPQCVLLCGMLGWMAPVCAQTQPHSLSVDVEPVSSDRSIGTNGSTHSGLLVGPGGHSEEVIHGNQTQITKEDKAIEITVRNFGPLPDTAQVQWYFVAVPAKVDPAKPRSEQETIFDDGQQSVSLDPGAKQTFKAQSKDVVSKLKKGSSAFMSKRGRLDPSGSGKKTTGKVFEGWMVRVVADGRVIDSRGSNDALSDVAKDDVKFDVLKER